MKSFKGFLCIAVILIATVTVWANSGILGMWKGNFSVFTIIWDFRADGTATSTYTQSYNNESVTYNNRYFVENGTIVLTYSIEYILSGGLLLLGDYTYSRIGIGNTIVGVWKTEINEMGYIYEFKSDGTYEISSEFMGAVQSVEKGKYTAIDEILTFYISGAPYSISNNGNTITTNLGNLPIMVDFTRISDCYQIKTPITLTGTYTEYIGYGLGFSKEADKDGKFYLDDICDSLVITLPGFSCVYINGKYYEDKKYVVKYPETKVNIDINMISIGGLFQKVAFKVINGEHGKIEYFYSRNNGCVLKDYEGVIDSDTAFGVGSASFVELTLTPNKGYEAIVNGNKGNSHVIESIHISENDFYNEIRFVPASVSVSKIKKSDSRYGIRFAQTIVSDKAQMKIVLENDRAAETKIVIYDMTGNAVFETTARGNEVSWNLTNKSGRFVANGTYLFVAQIKGANGKIYSYSAKLGVKR